MKFEVEDVTSPWTDIFGYSAVDAEVIVNMTLFPSTSFSLNAADSEGWFSIWPFLVAPPPATFVLVSPDSNLTESVLPEYKLCSKT